MKYELMPTVKLRDIVTELKDKYDIETTTFFLRGLLWFERPANDCYKPYYYGDGPYVDCNPVEAAVIDLMEIYFPDWDTVLIDVTW